MEVGMALPTMAAGYSRATTIEWCRRLDDAPFASVSAGERLTFDNPDALTVLAAAAALTERVRVFVNVAVLPWHPIGLMAKQLLTIEQLASGRLVVGVGVGGREEDYAAAGSSFAGRHARLDETITSLRSLWSGVVPEGASAPMGPRPASTALPPLLAGAMGPKAMARAADWADGVTGFSIGGVADEMAATFRLAEHAWADAGRATRPLLVTGCFFALGPDAAGRLRDGVTRYLTVFGRRFAETTADALVLSDADALRRVLDETEATGADELVLVPMSTDVACLEEAADVVASR